jgi:hypothetical protein
LNTALNKINRSRSLKALAAKLKKGCCFST